MAKQSSLNRFEAAEPLWKDRKRILGLPISFTRYTVDSERLTCHRGLLKTETDELLLYRILDIKCVRTLGQKLCGVGTVTLYSADKTSATLHLTNIKNAEKVRAFISRMVEYERASKGLVGREIYGASGFTGTEHVEPPNFVDFDGDGIPD
ncbi:MAG: PH domain-containing protein [Christensenellaceae bacterium]|jgi:hypothetical protein|nr:PH domain-containing protein [Christensenellaceae bacterium]